MMAKTTHVRETWKSYYSMMILLSTLLLLNSFAHAAKNLTSTVTQPTTTTAAAADEHDGFCKPSYRLTECENSGSRWRVAVPSSSACTTFHANASQLQRLSTCDVSCDSSGHHFNLSSLKCEKCQPGTFAAGPTLRITDWNLLPDGMTTENNLARIGSSFISARLSGGGGGDAKSQKTADCQNDYGWQALGEAVGILIPSARCRNLLLYPVTLAKAGYVSFTYRYMRSSEVLFQFDLLHGCRSRLVGASSDASSSSSKLHFVADDTSRQWGMRWPNATLPFVPPADEWTQIYVQLPAGETTLKWSAISTTIGGGSLDDALTALRAASDSSGGGSAADQRQPPIQIRQVVVDGLTGETLACTPCAPGMFAAESGSGKCEPCSQNFYANRHGSISCTPCDSNTFAAGGSSACELKPPCERRDLTALVLDSVNKNARAQCFPEPHKAEKRSPPVARSSSGKVSLHYKWATNSLCNPLSSAAELPTRKLIQCGEICSPGTQLTANPDSRELQCRVCPQGTYRSGSLESWAKSNESSNVTIALPAVNSHCQPCPANKIPRSGIWFTKFFNDVANWPSEMLNSTCYSSIRGGCFSQVGFRPNGEALVSERGVDGAVMVLQLYVNGFDANMPRVRARQQARFSSDSSDYYSPPVKRQQPQQEFAIGLLEFEFEMHCQTKKCFLELMLADIRAAGASTGADDDSLVSQTMPVHMWDYRHAGKGRIRYSVPFYRNASFTAIWTYSKFSLSELSNQKLQKFRQINYLSDYVAFYSVNVTNAIGGGADSCVTDIDDDTTEKKNATLRLQQQQCSAARGEYWDAKSHQCKRCGPFERLSASTTTDNNSGGDRKFCIACGHNLIADDSRAYCYSPCRIPFGKKSPKSPLATAHRNPLLFQPPNYSHSQLMGLSSKTAFLGLPTPIRIQNETDSDNSTNIFDWQNYIDLSAYRNQPLNVKSDEFDFEGDQASFRYSFQFALCGGGEGANNKKNGLQVECRENMSVLWQSTLFQAALGGAAAGSGVVPSSSSMSAKQGHAVRGAVCRTSLLASPENRLSMFGFRASSAAAALSTLDGGDQSPNKHKRLISTAPVVLADELVGVYTSLDLTGGKAAKPHISSKSASNDSVDVSVEQHEATLHTTVDEYFWDRYVDEYSTFQRGNAPNVHFVYKLSSQSNIRFSSDVPTTLMNKKKKCQERHVVITLQCIRDARRNGSVMLPPHCPTGTCDGCTYRFLMQTDQVCPPCIEAGVDYREVVEQCGVDGLQRVTRQPLVPFCRADLPSMVEWRACSLVPRWLIMLMLSLFVVLSLLMLVVLAQWNRTRSLQYKYSKLMAQSEYEADMAQQGKHAGGGSGGGSGRLPQVESCAMQVDEDVPNEEEEEEHEHFAKRQANGSQTRRENNNSTFVKAASQHKQLSLRQISLRDDNNNDAAAAGDFPTAQRLYGRASHSSTIFGRVRNLLHSTSTTKSTPSPTNRRSSNNQRDELALATRHKNNNEAAAPPSRSGTRRSERRGHSAQNRRHFYSDEGEAVQQHTASTAAAVAAAAALEAARSCGIDHSDTAYLVTNTGNSPDEDDSGAHTQLLA